MNRMLEISGRTCNKGFALIETLISFLVLAVGLVALLSFHVESQKTVSEAKSQAEAVNLAEQKLNELESFLSSTDGRLDAGGYGEENPLQGTVTEFELSWIVAEGADATDHIQATVIVEWEDRNGDEQSVQLSSDIYRKDPTEGISRFLANVATANQDGSENIWPYNEGNETPVDETDVNGEEAADENGDSTGIDGNGDDQTYTIYYISISGNVDAIDGNLTAVSVSNTGESSPIWECLYNSYTYTCESTAISTANSWNGSISFGSDATVCTPENGYASHTISDGQGTMDITQDVIIRRNNGQCNR